MFWFKICVYGFFLQTISNIKSSRHNLDDGGDGGSDERTPQMVRKKPVWADVAMLVMQVILLKITLTIMIMVMALITKQLVMITMLILGRAGRNQNRLSRWQWWLFDNLIVMVRYCQYQLRWYLGGQADVEQWQWWSFDYFYGDILPILTAMIPGRAGRNQTRLSKGTWEGVDTISGVICMSVKCHFFFWRKFTQKGNNVDIEQHHQHPHLGEISRKRAAVLLDFVQITSSSPSPQFGQIVPLFWTPI